MKKQVLIFTVLAIIGCGGLADIENQVAVDAVKQYEIAKRQGNKIQICVQAGLVSAAYLQAKNEAKYNEWKAIEQNDCRAAGMPQY